MSNNLDQIWFSKHFLITFSQGCMIVQGFFPAHGMVLGIKIICNHGAISRQIKSKTDDPVPPVGWFVLASDLVRHMWEGSLDIYG